MRHHDHNISILDSCTDDLNSCGLLDAMIHKPIAGMFTTHEQED